MGRLCLIVFLISLSAFPFCLCENQDEAGEGGFLTKTYNTIIQLLSSRDAGSTVPEPDVNRLLVSSAVGTSEVRHMKEQIRELEFERYVEKNANYHKKGLPLKSFEKYFRKVAENYDFPDEFVTEIISGMDARENHSQHKDFVFRTGEDSKIVYCRVATVRMNDKNFDIAIAFYSLDFKLTDHVIHRFKNEYLLGFIPWGTRHYTTLKPRKLTSDVKDLMVKFLRHQAIAGYIEDFPYLALSDESHGQHDEM